MEKKESRSIYESTLAVTLLLLLLHYFFWNNEKGLIGIILFVLLALLSKFIASGIDQLWNYATTSLGWVMSRVLLSVVFLVFLTPIALIYRLTRKKVSGNAGSNFIDRNYTYVAKDIETPW